MTEPWLCVVGIGEGGLDGLGATARALIDAAEVLVGGARHFAMLPDDDRERLTWAPPLRRLVDEIVSRRGQRICVLATGDPMSYGIGATLARRVPIGEMVVVPAPSAFSLARARMGWALADSECFSLHGRPLALLNRYIQPGARLLALADSGRTPARVASALAGRGYGASRITVLEHMGGPQERRIDATAAAWEVAQTADFNTIAIECIADAEARSLPPVPGLPDDAFEHDGQITKREVRAVTLSTLAPVPGQLLWDVGAGCGSIAIEWMRIHPRCRAVAIERNAARCRLIQWNAGQLGVPGLDVVHGTAPEALYGLEAPDAAFIGGGSANVGVFETCWNALKPGGRLVANAVTVEGERALAEWRQRVAGSLLRLAVERAAPVGSFTGWTPLRQVTQLMATKS